MHFENSLLFAAELFRNNVVFRQHSYPDVNILCSVKVVPSSANPKYFFYLLQPPRWCKCNRGCKGNLLPLTQNMNSFLRSRIALPTTADTFMKQWSNSSWNVFMRAFENIWLLNYFKSFSRTLLVHSNIFQKVVFYRLCSSWGSTDNFCIRTLVMSIALILILWVSVVTAQLIIFYSDVMTSALLSTYVRSPP